jgi:hypothetical protein
MRAGLKAVVVTLGLAALALPAAAHACSCSGPLPVEALKEAELVIEGEVRARRDLFHDDHYYLVEVTRVFKGAPSRWVVVHANSCYGFILPGPSYAFLRQRRMGDWEVIDCQGHRVADQKADLAKPLAEQWRNIHGLEMNVARVLEPLPAVVPPPGRTVLVFLFHQPWLAVVVPLGTLFAWWPRRKKLALAAAGS